MKKNYNSPFKFQSPKKTLFQGFKQKQITNKDNYNLLKVINQKQEEYKETIKLIEDEKNLKLNKGYEWADNLRNDTIKYEGLYNSDLFRLNAIAQETEIDEDAVDAYRTLKHDLSFNLPSTIRRVDIEDDPEKEMEYKINYFVDAASIVLEALNGGEFTWINNREPKNSDDYKYILKHLDELNKILNIAKQAKEKGLYAQADEFLRVTNQWETAYELYDKLSYLTGLTSFNTELRKHFEELQKQNEILAFKIMWPVFEEMYLNDPRIDIRVEDVVAAFWDYVHSIQEHFNLSSDGALEFARDYGYADLNDAEVLERTRTAANSWINNGNTKFKVEQDAVKRPKKEKQNKATGRQMKIDADIRLKDLATLLGYKYEPSVDKDLQKPLIWIRSRIDYDAPAEDVVSDFKEKAKIWWNDDPKQLIGTYNSMMFYTDKLSNSDRLKENEKAAIKGYNIMRNTTFGSMEEE